MRHFLPLFTFLCLLFSCVQEPELEPIDAARQKLTEAKSIAFEMQANWNNTYVGDSSVEAADKGLYLRNNQRDFPYDFIYDAESTTFLYLNGKLEDVQQKKGRIVTYSEEETK